MTPDPAKSTRARLALPAALSLAAHAAGAWLLATAAPNAEAPALAASQDPIPTKPEFPDLGVEESTAVTLNWVGFAEPTPATGKLATVDQAALTTDAGETDQQTQPTDPAPPTPPTPEPVTETPTTQPTESTQPQPTEPPLPVRPAQPGDDATIRTPENPSPNPAEPESPTETPPAQPTPSPPAQPTTNPAPQPVPDPGEKAIEDPRESAAAAVEPIEAPLNGRPIAREGLIIHTVRPDFSIVTMLTRAPRNPVVAITFGPDGRVIPNGVNFVRDPETKQLLDAGSTDRNEPLKNALFNWRAVGPRLADLAAEGTPNTITVEIRIVLRR